MKDKKDVEVIIKINEQNETPSPPRRILDNSTANAGARNLNRFKNVSLIIVSLYALMSIMYHIINSTLHTPSGTDPISTYPPPFPPPFPPPPPPLHF